MKYSTAAVVAALLPSAYGHYFWNRLIVGDVETGDDEFVRRSTRPIAYNPIKWKNVRDNSTPDLDDIRCNQGAFSSAASTGTKEVKAGSKVGFKLAVGATMQHPGPILAYVSRAPGKASEYRGDDDWIKIFEMGVCDTTKDFTKDAWCSWDKSEISFTLPILPNGEYLLRIEHIGLHGAHDGQAEFYPACSQIRVVGGSETGSLPAGIKLPGGYKSTDESFNFSLWNGYRPYPMPGGPLYTGIQAGNGTSNNGGSSSETAPASTATAGPIASSATAVIPTTLETATAEPTNFPTDIPTDLPSGFPTDVPSGAPTDFPAPSSTPAPTAGGAPVPTASSVPTCPNAPRRKIKRSRKAEKAQPN